MRWVYPRVYGETCGKFIAYGCNGGLSPRVRGNRKSGASRGDVVGSIPACTGKPITPANGPSCSTVYPRVYGETREKGIVGRASIGLSPRVRGNPAGPTGT